MQKKITSFTCDGTIAVCAMKFKGLFSNPQELELAAKISNDKIASSFPMETQNRIKERYFDLDPKMNFVDLTVDTAALDPVACGEICILASGLGGLYVAIKYLIILSKRMACVETYRTEDGMTEAKAKVKCNKAIDWGSEATPNTPGWAQ